MFTIKNKNFFFFSKFYLILFFLFPGVYVNGQSDSSVSMEGDLLNNGYVKVYSIEFLDNPIIIKKASFPIIDSIATILLKNPRIRIEISSYTEAKEGDNEKNVIEKEVQKAKAVCNYMAYKGVTETRFTCRGHIITKQTTPDPISELSLNEDETLNDSLITKDSLATDSAEIVPEKKIIPQEIKNTGIERPRIEFRIISR